MKVWVLSKPSLLEEKVVPVLFRVVVGFIAHWTLALIITLGVTEALKATPLLAPWAMQVLLSFGLGKSSGFISFYRVCWILAGIFGWVSSILRLTKAKDFGLLVLLAVLALALEIDWPAKKSGAYDWFHSFGFNVFLSTAFPVLAVFGAKKKKDNKMELRRGAKVMDQPGALKELQRLAQKETPKAVQPGISIWRDLRLPRSREPHHLLVIGSPGSGKTQLAFPLLQEILERGDKAVIWDIKGTYLQALFGETSAELLAPWDKRSLVWQLGADLNGSLNCHEIAHILIRPNPKESQPYFTNSARKILEAALIQLDAQRNNWGWSDLWEKISLGKEELAAWLGQSASGRAARSAITGDSNSTQDVYSTLDTATHTLKWLARAWKEKNVNIALRPWVRSREGPRALILGGIPEFTELASATASVALQILVSEILSMPDDLNRRIWLFLDELATLGKMDSLINAFTLGRSKGLCVVAGIQDIGRIEDLYGRGLAKSIANAFSTRIILKCTDSATAQWASEMIGQQEVLEHFKTKMESPSGSQEMSRYEPVSPQLRTQAAVMASEISQLPLSKESFSGYLSVSGWPVARLAWPIRPIAQDAPLVLEADWVRQREAIGAASALNAKPPRKKRKGENPQPQSPFPDWESA